MAKTPANFEESLQKLEALAEQIERGEIGLEESIKKYEEGMKLLSQCRKILTQAEQRISKLQPDKLDQTSPAESAKPPTT